MHCLKFFDWVACVMAALVCLVRAISVRGFLKSVIFAIVAEIAQHSLAWSMSSLRSFRFCRCTTSSKILLKTAGGGDIAFHCKRCMKYHIPSGVDMQITSASMKNMIWSSPQAVFQVRLMSSLSDRHTI